jgi:hypothetical protein
LPNCEAPSTCIVLADDHLAQQAVCSLTKQPTPECQRSTEGQICLGDVPVGCVDGYPVASNLRHCPTACIMGICSLSTQLDPNCPDSGSATNYYCGPQGPAECVNGYLVDPAVYGPVPMSAVGPCPVTYGNGSGDDAGSDAGLSDAMTD